MRVVGICHDDKSDGTGKAGLTFMSQNSFNQALPWNTDPACIWYRHAEGWAWVTLRDELNNDNGVVYSTIPDDLKANITTVKKQSHRGWEDQFNYHDTLNTTDDKLFLPSGIELGKKNDTSAKEEGYKYEYIENSVFKDCWPSMEDSPTVNSLNHIGFEYLLEHKSEFNDVGAANEAALWNYGGVQDSNDWNCCFQRTVSVKGPAAINAFYYDGTVNYPIKVGIDYRTEGVPYYYNVAPLFCL